MLLKVPFVPQTDRNANWYRNDCGPACVLHMQGYVQGEVRMTVNALSRRSRLVANGDKGLVPSDLVQLLGIFGVRAVVKHNLALSDLRNELRSHRPVILLVNYKHLGGKSFGHYVTLVGYDDIGFYVHDPYLKGANFPISSAHLLNAIEDVSKFAYFKYQGVLLAA